MLRYSSDKTRKRCLFPNQEFGLDIYFDLAYWFCTQCHLVINEKTEAGRG